MNDFCPALTGAPLESNDKLKAETDACQKTKWVSVGDSNIGRSTAEQLFEILSKSQYGTIQTTGAAIF